MFPVWYILVPFAAVVGFAALFLFFNVFHLMRYAVESQSSSFLLAMYVGGFLLILAGSAVLLSSYDWSMDVDPFTILKYNPGVAQNYGL